MMCISLVKGYFSYASAESIAVGSFMLATVSFARLMRFEAVQLFGTVTKAVDEYAKRMIEWMGKRMVGFVLYWASGFWIWEACKEEVGFEYSLIPSWLCLSWNGALCDWRGGVTDRRESTCSGEKRNFYKLEK